MLSQDKKYGPRLSMSLCYVSSEDVAFPAMALRSQTKFSDGWQSSKYCSYPQELGFCFEGKVFLHTIRILIHESKIPSSLEVHVADVTEAELQCGGRSLYETAKFVRLGHVPLSTNELHHFRARELKTVNIGRQCTYLKLVFARPHSNACNLFQQIGLVAIVAHGQMLQLFGEERQSVGNNDNRNVIPVGETVEISLEEMKPPSLAKHNSITTTTTTTTTPTTARGNTDPVSLTSQRIEELKALKMRAVVEEDFDSADVFKKQIEILERVALSIEKLEQEKMEAVAREDYLRAKELKAEISLLLKIDPGVPGAAPIISKGGLNSHKGDEATEFLTRPAISAASQESDPSRGNLHDEKVVCGRGSYELLDSNGDINQAALQQASGSHSPPAGDTVTGLEIPSTGGGEPWEQALNTIIARFLKENPAPIALTGSVAEKGKAYEKDLGVYAVGCLCAQRGIMRESAIRAIVSNEGHAALLSHSSTFTETLLNYFTAKGRGLGDSVAGVVLATCEALQKWIRGDLPQAPSPSLCAAVPKLLLGLVARLGDTNTRIREGVEGTIIAFARSSVGPEKIVSLLMRNFEVTGTKVANHRAHLSRINVIAILVDEYGVDTATNTHALASRDLMTFIVLPALQHSSSEVREAAVHLFAKLILLDGETCRPYLRNIKPAQQALVRGILNTKDTTAFDGGAAAMAKVSSTMGEKNPITGSALKTPERRLSTLHDEESVSAEDPSIVPAFTCQFCGEYNRNFNESNLDIHYVRYCPMLCPCPLCDQVTDIRTLQLHLVAECEGRRLVRECSRCREAVRAEEYKKHVASKNCIEAVPTHSVCPLCHARFKNTMNGWRKHLAFAPGCPNNPRKYDGSGPVLQEL